ncbi:MAG: ABC transporter ATP-binding protein [Spirochaetaceae bacterium]|jgi:oligopeptide transport system ATP-binding protein|nr:ABC transporter ATP-binding protein [Spirochaetaceae bacterium]
MANTNKPLLAVNNLEVSFFTHSGEVKAVGGISYSLKGGEVMGIAGESGSGKSVGAYSLMGLLEPPGRIIGGSVEFEGKNILAYSEKELRKIRGNRISMIFQNPMESLNPVYTIGSQLTSVLREHTKDLGGVKVSADEARVRALEMLQFAGITNPEYRLKQYPHELSGGMRQRVMIAMGLICEPSLLIADEPTTALDVTIQAQILELIKSMRRKNDMAVIFITHNLAAIAEICDTVAVMYGGRIVEQGPVEDIFYRPAHPYTKGLLRSIPRLDREKAERLIPIEGSPINMLNPRPGCPFAPRCEFCMKICVRQNPETKAAGGEEHEAAVHRAACWLIAKNRRNN